MGQRLGTTALLLVALGSKLPDSKVGDQSMKQIPPKSKEEICDGYLLRSLTAEAQCENIYQDFSDCILKLGENMASYEEEEEEKIQAQGLHAVCGYWDEFHTCAMTALWECQREAVTIWEMLKRESRKIKFPGSLFDLCAPSNSQNLSSVQIPTPSLLSITLMITWLNL